MARRDEFDDEEGFMDSILNRQERSGSPGSLRRILAVTAGLAVLGVLAAVLWSTNSSAPDGQADANVPIIRADAEPYRVPPEEPGGMAVPNKDSTIFNTLKGEKNQQAKVENLFEDQEKPVRKEEVFAATEQPTTPAPEAAKALASKMPDKAQPKIESVASAPVETPAAPPIDVAPKAEPAKPATAAAAKMAQAIQPAAGGNFFVQMASVKSEAEAKKAWPKYQAQYSGLSNLPLRVQKADLGAKGTYYRIQGGPLAEADARQLCSSINAQKSGSCVVAKR